MVHKKEMDNKKVPIVDLATGLKTLGQLQGNQTVVTFYSSVLGGITTERALFGVPIDDHMVHRGHAVFDTVTIKNGKAYGLDKHLDRFIKSATDCRILPLYAEKQVLREIILQTIARSGLRTGIYCRFWMSAGRGDFNINTTHLKRTEFYCAVHTQAPTGQQRIIKEVSVSVPVKCKLLATSKTNNYLVNALAAMEATERGGTLGLQCDAEGNIAECSIGSVGFVFAGENFVRTPKLVRILRSTTLLRSEELFAREQPSGRFVYQDISLKEALERSVEVIGFGGGHLSAITELDGKKIGDGNPGPVFTRLNELVEADFVSPSGEFLDDIPYE